jgi:GxxExxY protein
VEENECSNRILGAAIEVHRVLGAGLLESAYRQALAHELRSAGLGVECEVLVGMTYKGLKIPDAFRIDLMVQGIVVVEIKAIEKLLRV